MVAAEITTAPAIRARPRWTVVEAARVMAEQHVERLPVMDETDTLPGIVSRSDEHTVAVLLRLCGSADGVVAVSEDLGHPSEETGLTESDLTETGPTETARRRRTS
ncbi:CBS domain-containing protein [Streptomyces niveus]